MEKEKRERKYELNDKEKESETTEKEKKGGGRGSEVGVVVDDGGDRDGEMGNGTLPHTIVTIQDLSRLSLTGNTSGKDGVAIVVNHCRLSKKGGSVSLYLNQNLLRHLHNTHVGTLIHKSHTGNT